MSVDAAVGASTLLAITAKPAVGCRLSTRLIKPAIEVVFLLFIA